MKDQFILCLTRRKMKNHERCVYCRNVSLHQPSCFFVFQFQVMKLFPMLQFFNFNSAFNCDNRVLYTITDKEVDNNMVILQMFFSNLRFSRCSFCNSVSITKRAIFFFSLYVPFRIDILPLANVGISCCFLHQLFSFERSSFTLHHKCTF